MSNWHEFAIELSRTCVAILTGVQTLVFNGGIFGPAFLPLFLGPCRCKWRQHQAHNFFCHIEPNSVKKRRCLTSHCHPCILTNLSGPWQSSICHTEQNFVKKRHCLTSYCYPCILTNFPHGILTELAFAVLGQWNVEIY